jgi:hypothetical protein
MRSRHGVMIVLLAVCGWVAIGGVASATFSWPYVLPDTASDVLYGKPIAETGPFDSDPVENTVNGLVLEQGNPSSDFAFGPAVGDRKTITVHGLNHNLTDVRLWSAIDIPPAAVAILGNTTDTTDVNDPGWTTLVPTYALTGNWSTDLPAEAPNIALYHDFSVATTGTKSLMFDFGTTAGHTRISEVQAYGAAAPEPSTMILLAIGLVSLLAYAWRKRK